jgi:hypothetical protein
MKSNQEQVAKPAFFRFFSKIQVFVGISAKGLKFILKITDPSDLNRDVLKAFY